MIKLLFYVVFLVVFCYHTNRTLVASKQDAWRLVWHGTNAVLIIGTLHA
jgi:hypothetical protein